MLPLNINITKSHTELKYKTLLIKINTVSYSFLWKCMLLYITFYGIFSYKISSEFVNSAFPILTYAYLKYLAYQELCSPTR